MFRKSIHSFVSKEKPYIYIVQILFIFTLLVIWISDESIRQSKNLWILFFYNFPSQFLIALVPHEPIVIYFGEFYHPLTVSMVAIAGTVITEVLNYSMFKYVVELKSIERIQENKLTTKLVYLFNKKPFLALLIAGFTPVPFYPFRFLVVLAHYPIFKYALAVFLSRTPRFYILAALGHEIHIPTHILIIIFIILFIISYVSALKPRFNKKKINVIKRSF